eukprot:857519_1
MKRISAGVEKHKQGKTAIDPITKQNVYIEQFSDDEQGLIDTLDHFNYSHLMLLHNGMENGIAQIRRTLCLWVVFGIICVGVAATCIFFTIPLLNNINYAFVPAVGCLCVGSSSVVIGFNLLRLRAANKLKQYYMESQLSGNNNMEQLFERVYYPVVRKKTKETIVWSHQDVELVDQGA